MLSEYSILLALVLALIPLTLAIQLGTTIYSQI